jgi:hypothetical protein
MKQKLIFFALFIISGLLHAQAPQKFNYQAVARDTSGNLLVNQNITFRISILSGSISGTPVYQEKHIVTTNSYGQTTLNIGGGYAISGNFNSINWGDTSYFVKTEIYIQGGSDYLSMGTSQLLSVPYALYAKESGNGFSGNYTDLTDKPILSSSNDTIFLSGGSFVKLSSLLLPPKAITLPATDIQSFSATLNGIVNGRGLSTTVVFEWGTDITYGNTVIATNVTGSNDVNISLDSTEFLPGTIYHYRIKASNAVNVTYSNDMIFFTLNSSPQITTFNVSNVLATTATSGGEIILTGGETVIAKGVCYNTSSLPTTSNYVIPGGAGLGSFDSFLTGLTPSTTYYVRAYATNSLGTGYGSEYSFTTQSGIAIITTNSIYSITGTSAITGGNITSNGGASITARGVCYSTSPSPTTLNSIVSYMSPANSFGSNITGLALGTTYFVRAFATNAVGTFYGNQLTFTTIALPTVTTSTYTDVKGNSAKAGGSITNEGGSSITTQGLCWSTSPSPTIANSFSYGFSLPLTGLLSNTVYYLKAYATNSAGTGYGNQISFNSGYLMGSTQGGGLLFYNDGFGHGLVSASSDQSTAAQWGCEGTLVGTSTAINTGAANTNTIVIACTTAGIAAKLCNDLVLNTYSDWYLPSKDELYLMYLNLHYQGLGGFAIAAYWSSSEITATNVWDIAFNYGTQNGNYKSSISCYVRAIRSF